MKLMTWPSLVLIFLLLATRASFGATAVEPGATQRHEARILEVKKEFVKTANEALFLILKRHYQSKGEVIAIRDVDGLLDENASSSYFDEYDYLPEAPSVRRRSIPDDEQHFDDLWSAATLFAKNSVEVLYGLDYFSLSRVGNLIVKDQRHYVLHLPTSLKVTVGGTTRIFDVVSPGQLHFLAERIEAAYITERAKKLGTADDIVKGWVGGTGVIYLPFDQAGGRAEVDPMANSYQCERETSLQKIRIADSKSKSEIGFEVFPYLLPDGYALPWAPNWDLWMQAKSCAKFKMRMTVVPE